MQNKNNQPKGKNRRHRFVFRRIIGQITVDFGPETPVRNPVYASITTSLDRIEKRLDAIDSRLDDIKKSLCNKETEEASQAEVEKKVDILIDGLLRKELMQDGVLKLTIKV